MRSFKIADSSIRSLEKGQEVNMRRKRKATIYYRNIPLGFIEKQKVWLINHGILKCQFFNDPPFVIFVRQDERRTQCKIIQTHDKYLLILEGWNNPDVSKHLYPCHFDPEIEKLAASGVISVLADYRDLSV